VALGKIEGWRRRPPPLGASGGEARIYAARPRGRVKLSLPIKKARPFGLAHQFRVIDPFRGTQTRVLFLAFLRVRGCYQQVRPKGNLPPKT